MKLQKERVCLPKLHHLQLFDGTMKNTNSCSSLILYIYGGRQVSKYDWKIMFSLSYSQGWKSTSGKLRPGNLIAAGMILKLLPRFSSPFRLPRALQAPKPPPSD